MKTMGQEGAIGARLERGGMRMAIKKMRQTEFGRLAKTALGALLVLGAALALAGCYLPGVGSLPEAKDPLPAGGVSGLDETLYGKFIIYQVGNSKIGKLGGGSINYMVGDEVYFPSNDGSRNNDYNINHSGNEPEPELTFNYKDNSPQQRPGSSRPEAIIVNGHLNLFYTNARTDWMIPSDAMVIDSCTASSSCPASDVEASCGYPKVGDTVAPSIAYPIKLNSLYVAMFNSPTPSTPTAKVDVDVYQFNITQPKTLVVFRARFQMFNAKDPEIQSRHALQISLRDGSNNPLPGVSSSHAGMDFAKFNDPDLTYYFPAAGTNYLVVEDLLATGCTCQSNDTYWLWTETPNQDVNGNVIMKGELQPARNGNPKLSGGDSFEPDDTKTVPVDNWPDCDGIPGSGDEGDAGIFENCNGIKQFGAGDDVMQYQEVDNKTSIDDGEWFKGKPTNVPAVFGSEASIIHDPGQDRLLMFINYGSRIYMLPSRDGLIGLDWDLSNLTENRPALVSREERAQGDPEGPVVTSGPLGFCDTWPIADDSLARNEFRVYSQYGNTVAGVVSSPSGYPDQSAVTQGGNGYLDSPPLADVQHGRTIDSGPDGIVNTFFAPRYIAYMRDPLPNIVPPYGTPFGDDSEPIIEPQPGERFHGPGNPDDPEIFSSSNVDYINPLGDDALPGYTVGSDRRGYLLGPNDEWNRLVFPGNTAAVTPEALTPPAYMWKQHCNFFELGKSFDQCAMGAPLVKYGTTYEQPIAVTAGNDGRLDTATEVLKAFRGDDILCHEGNTVAICPGPDGKFGWKDLYIPLWGDDQLEIVRDTIFGNTTARRVVGIGPGPNGILQTTLFPDPMNNYGLLDLRDLVLLKEHDYFCQTLSGETAICPGLSEDVTDLWSNLTTTRSSRKLQSLWILYVNSPTSLDQGNNISAWPAKTDLYGVYDDYPCIVNGGIAICPGPNQKFDGYPMHQRVIQDQDPDLFVLHQRSAKYLGKECYSTIGEIYKDNFSGEEKVRWMIYHDLGVRGDDRIMWSARRGWHIRTGPNGINQTCMANGDVKLIGMNRGVPNQPIIDGSTDGLQTYPLADEKISWRGEVDKVSAGPDGVSNSYAMGDDRMEIFMGAGKPDYPCVKAGANGRADTTARGNDSQLVPVGDYAGFDAYEVWGPEAMAVGKQIRLYYSGLGWKQIPEQFRRSSGGLSDLGECFRPGLDNEWGNNKPDRGLSIGSGHLYTFLPTLIEDEFKKYLDNNQGVLKGPRIGVAVSDVDRLAADPSDWTIYPDPAIDIGERCAATQDPLIDISGLLGFPLYFTDPNDMNLSGAMSPEIVKTKTEGGDHDLFIMFYTGLTFADITILGFQTKSVNKPNATIGVARSIDGVKWDVIRDLDPILSGPGVDLGLLLSTSTSNYYAYPTVVEAGMDTYGEPIYGMFFNQFDSTVYDSDFNYYNQYDMAKTDYIGYALRMGKTTPITCSISADSGLWKEPPAGLRGAVSIGLFAVPFLIILGLRLRKRTQA